MIVLVAARSPARATVVIESYALERPLDADAILGPVYAGLHERGVHARPEQVLREIRGALPMPGNDNFDVDPSDVIQRIDLGMSKARYGKHDEAIHLLEKAVEDLRNNPAMTTSLVDGWKWITKALAGLARAHLDKGNLQQAAEVIAEHVRSFPELPIDRGTYGPKLASFYLKARAVLDARPHGRLLLIVDWADAQIFVNEYERGAGGVVDMTFPPGEYRLMIRVGGSARRYRPPPMLRFASLGFRQS
jgi:tetratricopeptide (TPR) repeat protein